MNGAQTINVQWRINLPELGRTVAVANPAHRSKKGSPMKLKGWTIVVALTALLLNPFAGTAMANFGNTPLGGAAFDFIANGGLASGGAVAFTPQQDFSFTSITAWMTGYTGLDMYGNQNQGFYAGIYSDQLTVEAGYTSDQPGMLLANLSSPAPNDGSLAPFEFVNLSPDLVLHADTKYWLFIYEKTSGSFNYDAYPQWVEGDSPIGKATYNGSQNFWAYDFSSSSATPAFAINAVPEPGAVWMFGGGLLIWGAFQVLKIHRLRRAAVRNARRHPPQS
jgi:hypothetical protein